MFSVVITGGITLLLPPEILQGDTWCQSSTCWCHAVNMLLNTRKILKEHAPDRHNYLSKLSQCLLSQSVLEEQQVSEEGCHRQHFHFFVSSRPQRVGAARPSGPTRWRLRLPSWWAILLQLQRRLPVNQTSSRRGQWLREELHARLRVNTWGFRLSGTKRLCLILLSLNVPLTAVDPAWWVGNFIYNWGINDESQLLLVLT